MIAIVRNVVAIIGWSLFWAAVVLGIATMIMEWQILERMMGL